VCLLRRPVGRYVRRGATRGGQGTFETRAPRRAPRGGRSCCTVLGCRPITIDKPQASETDAWRRVQCLLSYRHRDLAMPPAYSTDDRRNGSQARPASRRRPGDKYGNGSPTPSTHTLLRVLRVCVSSIRGGCTLEAVARDVRHVPRCACPARGRRRRRASSPSSPPRPCGGVQYFGYFAPAIIVGTPALLARQIPARRPCRSHLQRPLLDRAPPRSGRVRPDMSSCHNTRVYMLITLRTHILVRLFKTPCWRPSRRPPFFARAARRLTRDHPLTVAVAPRAARPRERTVTRVSRRGTRARTPPRAVGRRAEGQAWVAAAAA
jgi:hypothetical protein